MSASREVLLSVDTAASATSRRRFSSSLYSAPAPMLSAAYWGRVSGVQGNNDDAVGHDRGIYGFDSDTCLTLSGAAAAAMRTWRTP